MVENRNLELEGKRLLLQTVSGDCPQEDRSSRKQDLSANPVMCLTHRFFICNIIISIDMGRSIDEESWSRL